MTTQHESERQTRLTMDSPPSWRGDLAAGSEASSGDRVPVAPSSASPSSDASDIVPRTLVEQMPHEPANDVPERAIGLPPTIGPYAIESELGRGGMGIVYAAIGPRGGRFAIKTVNPDCPVARHVVEQRLRAEAACLKRLRHANVLELKDVGIDAATQSPFYVMPLIEGGSLQQHRAPGMPMDPRTVIEIGVQVADALAYAHDKGGVIHRDVKPSNLLLESRSGRDHVLVCDFGLVRSLFGESIEQRSGTWTVGTLAYMPPEVLAGNAGDTRVDVYSLGAMLYDLLAGRPAYDAIDLEELRRQMRSTPPAPLAALVADLPAGLDAVVAKAMAHDLSDRYAHMADLLGDLRCLAAGNVPLHAGVAAASRQPIRRVNGRLSTAVGASALVAALAFAVLVLSRRGGAVDASQPSTKQTTASVHAEPNSPRTRLDASATRATSPATTTAQSIGVSLQEMIHALDSQDVELLRRGLLAGRSAEETIAVDGSTLIERAIERGSPEQVRILLETKSVRVNAWRGSLVRISLAHVAARHGRVDLLGALRDAGADFNAASPDTGSTPLHEAVLYRELGMVAALLEQGVSPLARNRAGQLAVELIGPVDQRDEVALQIRDLLGRASEKLRRPA